MFGPGEVVYNQGDDDHSVYFIRKGYADMQVEKQKGFKKVHFHVKELTTGQIFGMKEFCAGQAISREYTIRANTVLHVLYISH